MAPRINKINNGLICAYRTQVEFTIDFTKYSVERFVWSRNIEDSWAYYKVLKAKIEAKYQSKTVPVILHVKQNYKEEKKKNLKGQGHEIRMAWKWYDWIGMIYVILPLDISLNFLNCPFTIQFKF